MVRVAEQLEARGVPVVWLPVPESGRIEPGDVEQALSGSPPGAFVALMAVNHETGVLQPLAEVFDITTRARAHLHVDAVQAIGRLPPKPTRTATPSWWRLHKIPAARKGSARSLSVREGARAHSWSAGLRSVVCVQARSTP